MDDISSKISQILSSPDSMDNLKSIASALFNNSNTENTQAQDSGISAEQIQTFMKLSNTLSKLNTENNTTSLLLALRPHLNTQKQQKIDKAIKFIKFMNIMPVIQESGILPFNL